MGLSAPLPAAELFDGSALLAGICFDWGVGPTADPLEVIRIIRKRHLFPCPLGADLFSPMQLFIQVALIDEIFFSCAVEFFNK